MIRFNKKHFMSINMGNRYGADMETIFLFSLGR